MATIEKQLKNTLSTAIQYRFAGYEQGKLPITKITVQYVASPRGIVSKPGWVVRVQFEGDFWMDEVIRVWLENKFEVKVLNSRSRKTRKGSGFWGGRGSYHPADVETTTVSYWLGKIDLKMTLEAYR